MDTNERLMELYAFAFAPLATNSLLNDVNDLSPEEITTDLILEEAKYFEDLQSAGLPKFHECLRDYEGINDEEFGVAVQCYAAFMRRLKHLSEALQCLATGVGINYDCSNEILSIFTEDVMTRNRRPISSDLRNLFDFTPNCKWLTPEVISSKKQKAKVSGGRVGFKETATVISEGNQEAEAAVKMFESKRKKYRNPTGYSKFTFKSNSISEYDGHMAEDSRSCPMSTSASSIAGRDSRASSEADVSYGRSDSIAEEIRLQEDLNPFRKGSQGRMGSSVNFSFDKERQEIQDDISDPQWSLETRRSSRVERIRNRIPTGYSNIMKKRSDELAELLKDELEDNSNDLTTFNTNKNAGL